jgi:molybdenum cofactor cytidylyltransferase
MNLAVVLLAAGASSRMGRPKLLLPWAETTVLDHLLRQWTRLSPTQITIVCAPGNNDLAAALDAISFPRQHRIINPAPETGMFGSVQCAARWSGWDTRLTQWAITLGDQPQVRFETLEELAAFAAKNLQYICQPSRNDRPRHPVFLPAKDFRELRITKATNLKIFLQEREASRKLLPVTDPGLDHDLDSPQDYEEAKRLFLQ